MSRGALPRFFAPSERPEPAGAPADVLIEHCVDSFRLASAGVENEVIVGANRLGELIYARGAESGRLSERARRERNLHEISCLSVGRAPARLVRAERLYLFEMAFLEQLSGGGELNRPVHAYGTLVGPVGAGAAPRVRGQLTLTRADLLEGFALGKDWAFRCGAERGGSRACYHAALPGGLAEEIAQGLDVLLAYPLPPSELADEDLENSAIAQLLIGELVEGVRQDLTLQEAARGTLAKLFVASRAAQLAREEAPDLARSFARLSLALSCVPEWPSARAQALRARIGSAQAPARQTGPARGPTPSSSAAQPAPEKPCPLQPSKAAEPRASKIWQKPTHVPPDWTRDFLPQQHRQSAPSSYVVWKPPPKKQPETEAWMEDFRVPQRTQEHDSADADGNRTRPDWMRDFEDE